MVVGGVAVSTWATPRLTRDVDIIVLASKKERSRLRQAFVDAGARPTSTDLRLLYEKKWVRLKTAGPRLDVHLAASAHDRVALKQAVIAQVERSRLPLATVEDLILYKLAAGRDQDLADIDTLVREVKALNRAYIARWAGPVGESHEAPVRERWEAAQLRSGKR